MLALIVLAVSAASAWGQAYATHRIEGLAGAKLANVLKARTAIAKLLPGRVVRIALIERRRRLLWSAQVFDGRGVLSGIDLLAQEGTVDQRYAMSTTAAKSYPAGVPRTALEKAVHVATKSRSGTVIEIRLDKFESRAVWSVHLVDAKAQRWGVLVDARTGKIVTGK